MKKIIIALLMTSFSFAQQTVATENSKIGGGELNPGIYTNQKSIKEFQDLKLGISIHWGPNSIAGEEISWSRGKETPAPEYDQFYKSFNPTKFDANQWASLIDSFGAKYIIITTKHHDGFSMWHSDFSEYDISKTPFQRDILKELSQACKKKSIVFGTYYSTLDWFHPDYQPYGKGGPGKIFPTDETTPNLNRYWIYAKNQVSELINKYQSKIIQFDGDWDVNFTHNVGSDLYLYIRKLNDNVIVNSRTDKGRYDEKGVLRRVPWDAKKYAGDFEERERLTSNLDDGSQLEMLGKSNYPWQAWVTLDKSQWSWKKNFKFLSSEELVVDFLKTVGDGGNYLINVGPKPDGTFEQSAIDVLKRSGTWIKSHANAIYATTGGPFVKENEYTSTKKGKQIFVFVFKTDAEKLELNSKFKVLNITDENKKPIQFDQTGDKLTINLGKSSKESFVKVYTITQKN